MKENINDLCSDCGITLVKYIWRENNIFLACCKNCGVIYEQNKIHAIQKSDEYSQETSVKIT